MEITRNQRENLSTRREEDHLHPMPFCDWIKWTTQFPWANEDFSVREDRRIYWENHSKRRIHHDHKIDRRRL
jgi:hypothetical protein